MALVNVREVYPGVTLGLWQIEESVDAFFKRYPWTQKYRGDLARRYTNDVRRLEFLATRVLLCDILLSRGLSKRKISDLGEISYDLNGKPLFKGYQISISHTKGYAAMILSKDKRVGVDIEYLDNRVQRVASKFLRKDEKAADLDSLLVHWCGKETVYKLFSEEKLQFKEMRVAPFDTMSDWSCEIMDLKSKCKVLVDFELTMDFVLTYAAL